MGHPHRLLPLSGALAAGVLIGWAGAALWASGSLTRRVRSVSASTMAQTNARSSAASDLALENRSDKLESVPEKLSVDSPAFAQAIRGVLALEDDNDREIRLYELVNALDPVDFPKAFTIVAALKTDDDRDGFFSALGERWAELAPQPAAGFGWEHRRGARGDPFLRSVLEKWSVAEPKAAIAWLEALPLGIARNDLAATAVSTIGEIDPAGAVRLMQRPGFHLSGGRMETIVQDTFEQWADADPVAAGNAAIELKSVPGKKAREAVAHSWGGKNPRAALSWAAGLRNASARQEFIAKVGVEWAETDPAGAVVWAQASEDAFTKGAVLEKAIPQLAISDDAAALAAIQSLPAGYTRGMAVIAAVGKLASQDAQSAAGFVEKLPAGPDRTRAAGALCATWGAAEPQAALKWVVANTPGALETVEASRTLEGWVGKAPQDALAWAQTLPAGQGRSTALARITENLVDTDFTQAQAIFDQMPPDGQAMASRQMINHLYPQDPEKARAWAKALPSGSAQNHAFNAVASKLAEQDPAQAAQWMETLPEGPARDNAISGFSESIESDDPATALAWALSMADAHEREREFESLAWSWLSSDAAAARAWIAAANGLTNAQKSRFLTP